MRCQGQTHTLVGKAKGMGIERAGRHQGVRRGEGEGSKGHSRDAFAPEILLTVVAYYHTAVSQARAR